MTVEAIAAELLEAYRTREPVEQLTARYELTLEDAYAIQLANNNVWEANTGFNNLNHTVSVAP